MFYKFFSLGGLMTKYYLRRIYRLKIRFYWQKIDYELLLICGKNVTATLKICGYKVQREVECNCLLHTILTWLKLYYEHQEAYILLRSFSICSRDRLVISAIN